MPNPLSFDPIDEAGRQWRKHWGAASAPPMMAVTSMMRAQQIILARLNEALEPYKLSFPRYEALLLLYFSREGELPLGKMGLRLQVHPTSVTSLIDGLEGLGYVVRSAHPTDRRTTLASITDAGREVAARSTEALNAIRFGTEPLSRTDVTVITDVLHELRRAAGDFTEED